jgi:exopolyphosphatase / guanosine-5'-triphosphate,3'-diphosphate pyrophosphatase
MRLRQRRTVRRGADDGAVSWRSTRASARGAGRARQVAVIDLGSNSWRLVVFMYEPGRWWKRTDELYETVRIGAGLGASGRLSEAAMRRGLETLTVFARFCRANSLAPRDVYPVATSAIRDALNRDEFLQRAQEATGLEIEVISAEDEARYGYVAAVNTSTISDGVVVELGGGSMQLVEVQDRRAQDLRSFQLGAVRLTEQFLATPGAPKKKDLQKVRTHVREALDGVDWLAGSGGRLLGMGGASRNLAAAAQHAAEVEIDIGIQGYVISAETMAELVQRLAGLPTSERGSVPGIKPGRGDIILAAALALETVLHAGGFDGIEVTEAGLRDGVFLARTMLAADRSRDGESGEPGRRAGGRRGREPLFDDVRRAAVHNLAIQYEADIVHSEHVARLSLQMHESLVKAKLFDPKPGERELLWAASMLHDVGMTISYDDHHKHSHYVIVSAELPGFDPRERALIAQISRYHRKGAPKLGEMSSLAQKGDDALLERCAVILRLAEHLERGRDQSVSEARLRANGDGVDLHLEAAGDLTLPRWSVERYGDDEIFQRVFGRRLLIG